MRFLRNILQNLRLKKHSENNERKSLDLADGNLRQEILYGEKPSYIIKANRVQFPVSIGIFKCKLYMLLMSIDTIRVVYFLYFEFYADK